MPLGQKIDAIWFLKENHSSQTSEEDATPINAGSLRECSCLQTVDTRVWRDPRVTNRVTVGRVAVRSSTHFTLSSLPFFPFLISLDQEAIKECLPISQGNGHGSWVRKWGSALCAFPCLKGTGDWPSEWPTQQQVASLHTLTRLLAC